MPGYVERALQQFCSPERSNPYQWNSPTYGSQLQIASVPDTSKPLDEGYIKRLQKVVRLLFYHARVVNSPVYLPSTRSVPSK